MSRIEELTSKLYEFYGPLTIPRRDPFGLFVWEILSARTTPTRREAAFAALKRARALTPDVMSRVPGAKLEAAVALAGPYLEQRLQALKIGTQLFRRSPGLTAVIRGPLPTARRALKPLPQLDDAWARRMLLFAADHRVFPVDSGARRVAVRLGYGGQSESRRSERSLRRALSQELPPDLDAFRKTSLYLSHHGATTCTEHDPHCRVCPLVRDCPEGTRRTA